jgi:hypothetical protein
VSLSGKTYVERDIITSIQVSLSGQMYVETEIITSILVSLSGKMYVETDIITSILVSLSGQMYVETDIILLGLWCSTLLSTIFLLYRCGQFYCWRKPEYLGKTIDLP